MYVTSRSGISSPDELFTCTLIKPHPTLHLTPTDLAVVYQWFLCLQTFTHKMPNYALLDSVSVEMSSHWEIQPEVTTDEFIGQHEYLSIKEKMSLENCVESVPVDFSPPISTSSIYRLRVVAC